MPDLHFAKLAPHTSQIVHFTVVYFSSFIKYHSCLSQLTMLLVKLCKLHPKSVRFARRQFGVHRLNCLCVRVNDFFRFSLVQFHSFMPFVYIVGILTQKNAKKQKEKNEMKLDNDNKKGIFT